MIRPQRLMMVQHNQNPLLKSLPDDKLLDQSKSKAFADDKIKVAEMIIFIFDRVENILEKRR